MMKMYLYFFDTQLKEESSNAEVGVQLGSLGTTATNRPVVPAPSDYDGGEIGGMMTGRGN
jgi:hypothetical protein